MADTGAQLAVQDDGSWRLAGRFDYQSVVAIKSEGDALIRSLASRTCRLDLSQVEAGGSVFMALLLSWLRLCEARGISMELAGVPAPLFDMARVSGLDSVLPIAGKEGGRPAAGEPARDSHSGER